MAAVTDAGGTVGIPMPRWRSAQGRVLLNARVQSGPTAARRASFLVALLALAGVVLPTEVQISLGEGARFTSGRIAAALLFFFAFFELCKKGRRFVLCELFAVAAAAWMIVATVSSAGLSAISSAGGEALDLLGGYLIARAYIVGRPALDTFVRVLKVFAIIAVVFAMADHISGRMFVHETITAIYGSQWYPVELRSGWVRAASTFDHPILFGVFCALTAAILLYWEKNLLRRNAAVGVCLLGCLLSLSSAALMTITIVLTVYTYDRLMKRYSWRWGAFWIAVGLVSFAVVVTAEHPLTWIISHLTLDPQTGFFRIMVWDTALTYIWQSPLVGYGYQIFNNGILDGTVDSIWLLYTLRFGVPMSILFILANVTAILPSERKFRGTGDVHMDQMRRAFTLVLLMFVFTGVTVHFWNYMLMFWGLCIGIRGSLRESAAWSVSQGIIAASSGSRRWMPVAAITR